jgi:hypothetical protein
LGARSGHRDPGDPSTHDEDPSFGTVWHGRLRPRRFYRPWSTLVSSPARAGAADVAGLTVPTIAGPATGAATLTLADTVDALRYALGGPCVTALLEPDPVQDADDLDAEDRWPEFATAAAHQTPVRSVLSYRLAFTPNSVRDTADVAGHATIALAYLAPVRWWTCGRRRVRCMRWVVVRQ